MKKTLILFIIFIISCSKVIESVDPLEGVSGDILFIGNSLFYTADLDKEFVNSAESNENDLFVRSVSLPAFFLKEHVNEEETNNAINERHWENVILQENTYGCFDDQSKYEFINAVNDIKEKFPDSTKVWLLERWMPRNGYLEYSYEEYYKLNKECYSEVSQITGVEMLKVMTAWYEFNELYPEVEIYDIDSLHTSTIGANLTNAIIFEELYETPNNAFYFSYAGVTLEDGTKIRNFLEENEFSFD